MSTTDVVVAKTSFCVGTRTIVEGELFHADDPVIQGREINFEAPFVNDIEQATAAPGEKRSTKIRGRKPKPRPSVDAPPDPDAGPLKPHVEVPADVEKAE